MLLFVGRLQELKGADLALETLIELRQRGRKVFLAIVGGPSGPDGRATFERLRRRVAEAGVIDQVLFVAPQAHQLLSTWMRAADVTLVPSRAESFGLVALGIVCVRNAGRRERRRGTDDAYRAGPDGLLGRWA